MEKDFLLYLLECLLAPEFHPGISLFRTSQCFSTLAASNFEALQGGMAAYWPANLGMTHPVLYLQISMFNLDQEIPRLLHLEKAC